MKKYNSDYEKLSAYIDGELPLSEKNELEQKISVSPELKKKLLELKQIKEVTSGAFKKLPESPYLETRILAGLKSGQNKVSFIKRNWVPVAGLVSVTIILMLVLSYNPNIIKRLVEEQSTNLASFYKENLKPLLYASNLSNEDIFNFAFYKELPLDNNKEQFLQIGQDSSGAEYFEIKKSSYNIQENNYERFVTALNLDNAEKQQFDSILQHYAAELQAQVLVNDRNAVAINPNLWNYNRAIAADLVQFASTVNEPEIRNIIPDRDKFFQSDAIYKIAREVKSNDDNNYIFLTPDTIFTSWIDIDTKEMKEELRKAKEEIRRAGEFAFQNNQIERTRVIVKLDSLRHIRDKNYKRDLYDVLVSDNNYRVEIKEIEIPEIPVPDFDSISAYVDRVMQNVQIFTTASPKNPTRLSKRYNFQYGYKDTLKGVVVSPLPKIDSMLNFNYNYYEMNDDEIDSLVSHYMPKFRFKQDSLTNYFKMYNDSTRYLYEYDLQEQLREVEKEMRKFREEMQNLRKELKKDTDSLSKPKSIKKPVEI